MNYHIVRTNDALEKIASIYNLTITEIKNINTHISNWENLVPGTRLKLPPIPESISEELDDTEPFIEDYYPKIDIKKYESNNEEEFYKEQIDEMNNSFKVDKDYKEFDETSLVEQKNNSTKFTNAIKLPPSYSYYYNPYDYYKYMRMRKSRRNT